MPELEAVIEKVVEAKRGTHPSRGDWTLWHVYDKNETKFATFNRAHYDAAHNGIGKRFKLTYDENDKGKTLKEIAGPLKEEPVLGTGDYVRAQTAPNDKKSITASVALKAAVDTLSHTVKTDATPKDAANRIEPLAEFFYIWLCKKAGIDITPADDEIPF